MILTKRKYGKVNKFTVAHDPHEPMIIVMIVIYLSEHGILVRI